MRGRVRNKTSNARDPKKFTENVSESEIFTFLSKTFSGYIYRIIEKKKHVYLIEGSCYREHLQVFQCVVHHCNQ